MKFRRRAWTPEEDGLLREYAKTMSHHTIAVRLRRTPAAIRTRERELGIPGQKLLRAQASRSGKAEEREDA